MAVNWHNLNYFLICYLTFNQYCESCTPFTVKNLGSFYSTILEPTLKVVKDSKPDIDSITAPDFFEQLNAGYENEDVHLNITQLLIKYGYNVEQHQVITIDGYILDIFRIPGNGSVVLAMHGILSSSDDFVTTGSDRGLAYMLADQGYDVWLGNARGNVHGRKHKIMSPDCAEFWDFSWDEIGRYDVPATIDYILATTGKDKLAYVGHSQGCTSFFVMTSELPEYNDKISVMIAMSAVAYLKNSESLALQILAPSADALYLTTKATGLYELVPRDPITNSVTSAACGNSVSAILFCYNAVAAIFGVDYEQTNGTILPVYYGHFPAGSATKQVIHYFQLVTSGKFQNFDYGSEGNLEKYGLRSPPVYSLNKITSKIVVFHADNDLMSTTPDRERLLAELPNVIETYRVPHASFIHGDYLSANDLKTLVNDKVLEVIKKWV